MDVFEPLRDATLREAVNRLLKKACAPEVSGAAARAEGCS